MPEQQEVYRNYGFFVEIQGERAGFFMRIHNLGQEVESIEYREGGVPAGVRKLPGRTKVYDITLEQGVAQSETLWRWLDTAVQGRVERRNVSIVLLGPDGLTEVLRWNLTNCWVRQVEVADFDALGNDVLIERMTLAAEALERAPSAGAA